MDYLDPTCRPQFIQKSSLPRHLLANAPLKDALESQILQAGIL
jgi:hypothetical protein